MPSPETLAQWRYTVQLVHNLKPLSSCFISNTEVNVVTNETYIPFGTTNFPFLDIVESFPMANQVKKLVLHVGVVRVVRHYNRLHTTPRLHAQTIDDFRG